MSGSLSSFFEEMNQLREYEGNFIARNQRIFQHHRIKKEEKVELLIELARIDSEMRKLAMHRIFLSFDIQLVEKLILKINPGISRMGQHVVKPLEKSSEFSPIEFFGKVAEILRIQLNITLVRLGKMAEEHDEFSSKIESFQPNESVEYGYLQTMEAERANAREQITFLIDDIRRKYTELSDEVGFEIEDILYIPETNDLMEQSTESRIKRDCLIRDCECAKIILAIQHDEYETAATKGIYSIQNQRHIKNKLDNLKNSFVQLGLDAPDTTSDFENTAYLYRFFDYQCARFYAYLKNEISFDKYNQELNSNSKINCLLLELHCFLYYEAHKRIPDECAICFDSLGKEIIEYARRCEEQVIKATMMFSQTPGITCIEENKHIVERQIVCDGVKQMNNVFYQTPEGNSKPPFLVCMFTPDEVMPRKL